MSSIAARVAGDRIDPARGDNFPWLHVVDIGPEDREILAPCLRIWDRNFPGWQASVADQDPISVEYVVSEYDKLISALPEGHFVRYHRRAADYPDERLRILLDQGLTFKQREGRYRALLGHTQLVRLESEAQARAIVRKSQRDTAEKRKRAHQKHGRGRRSPHQRAKSPTQPTPLKRLKTEAKELDAAPTPPSPAPAEEQQESGDEEKEEEEEEEEEDEE